MRTNKRCWVTCRDCGIRKMEMQSIFERRTIPRCVYCGGIVDPSNTATGIMERGIAERKRNPHRRKVVE